MDQRKHETCFVSFGCGGGQFKRAFVGAACLYKVTATKRCAGIIARSLCGSFQCSSTWRGSRSGSTNGTLRNALGTVFASGGPWSNGGLTSGERGAHVAAALPLFEQIEEVHIRALDGARTDQ